MPPDGDAKVMRSAYCPLTTNSPLPMVALVIHSRPGARR
jgi:hypothetical protein